MLETTVCEDVSVRLKVLYRTPDLKKLGIWVTWEKLKYWTKSAQEERHAGCNHSNISSEPLKPSGVHILSHGA